MLFSGSVFVFKYESAALHKGRCHFPARRGQYPLDRPPGHAHPAPGLFLGKAIKIAQLQRFQLIAGQGNMADLRQRDSRWLEGFPPERASAFSRLLSSRHRSSPRSFCAYAQNDTRERRRRQALLLVSMWRKDRTALQRKAIQTLFVSPLRQSRSGVIAPLSGTAAE